MRIRAHLLKTRECCVEGVELEQFEVRDASFCDLEQDHVEALEGTAFSLGLGHAMTSLGCLALAWIGHLDGVGVLVLMSALAAPSLVFPQIPDWREWGR